jgi:hypothetical protein
MRKCEHLVLFLLKCLLNLLNSRLVTYGGAELVDFGTVDSQALGE